MILNSFFGFYGFGNPKSSGASKSNDPPTDPQRYNADYLKNRVNTMKTPYPDPEPPTLPSKGSDKFGWFAADKLNDTPISASEYNATYLKGNYQMTTPAPDKYTIEKALMQLEGVEQTTIADILPLVQSLAQTNPTWKKILTDLTQLRLIETQRPLNEKESKIKAEILQAISNYSIKPATSTPSSATPSTPSAPATPPRTPIPPSTPISSSSLTPRKPTKTLSISTPSSSSSSSSMKPIATTPSIVIINQPAASSSTPTIDYANIGSQMQKDELFALSKQYKVALPKSVVKKDMVKLLLNSNKLPPSVRQGIIDRGVRP